MTSGPAGVPGDPPAALSAQGSGSCSPNPPAIRFAAVKVHSPTQVCRNKDDLLAWKCLYWCLHSPPEPLNPTQMGSNLVIRTKSKQAKKHKKKTIHTKLLCILEDREQCKEAVALCGACKVATACSQPYPCSTWHKPLHNHFSIALLFSIQNSCFALTPPGWNTPSCVHTPLVTEISCLSLNKPGPPLLGAMPHLHGVAGSSGAGGMPGVEAAGAWQQACCRAGSGWKQTGSSLGDTWHPTSCPAATWCSTEQEGREMFLACKLWGPVPVSCHADGTWHCNEGSKEKEWSNGAEVKAVCCFVWCIFLLSACVTCMFQGVLWQWLANWRVWWSVSKKWELRDRDIKHLLKCYCCRYTKWSLKSYCLSSIHDYKMILASGLKSPYSPASPLLRSRVFIIVIKKTPIIYFGKAACTGSNISRPAPHNDTVLSCCRDHWARGTTTSMTPPAHSLIFAIRDAWSV